MERKTAVIAFGGAGVVGLGILGLLVWRRYKAARTAADTEAKVNEYLDAILKAETQQDAEAAAVAAGGAVARGEISEDDLRKYATSVMASNIGNIAGALIGQIRMGNIKADLIAEQEAQKKKEAAALQSAKAIIPAAPGSGGYVYNPASTGGTPPPAPVSQVTVPIPAAP
ncbi:MAG: hypothetical protein PHC52_00565 [Syntrophales bacterium]|nr:hypothetical protein [Syntrophales bacterium]